MSILTEIPFFTLRVEVFGEVRLGLHDKLCVQLNRFGELHVSPHSLLCGVNKAAWISSESLARQYRDALHPIFEKRYGNGTMSIVISPASTRDCRENHERIAADSLMISARLSQGVMAPNHRPKFSANCNEN